MTDENLNGNGEPVSTRTPRRSAASNKAWQTLMPHPHKKTSEESVVEEEEEQKTTVSIPPARALSSRGVKTTPLTTDPSPVPTTPGPAGPKTQTPLSAVIPATARTIVPAVASATSRAAPTAAAPSSHLQQQQRGHSDEEELEEASSELFPKPPQAAPKPVKKRGRPAKNGGGIGDGSMGGSSKGSTTGSLGKKMKLDNADDFEMEDDYEDGEEDYGAPPMLNRQNKLDPPYSARPSGKRKPRTPKTPSGSALEKKPRGPYKKKVETNPTNGGAVAGGGGGQYGSSAPGARSMQAIGRPVSAMPAPRPSTQMLNGTGGGGGGGGGARVVTIGPGGKVQAVSRSSLASPTMWRVAAGSAVAASAGGGMQRYPMAVASSQQTGVRLPGPQELLRTENSVDAQYRQARTTFSRHVVSGSSATEFNRVIDLLTLENKRLIAAQGEDQEYVDVLNCKIRSLENSVASLQRQLAVTTKAYHGAVLELTAERGGVAAAAAAPAARLPMGGVCSAAGAAPLKLLKREEQADDSEQKPKEEEGEGEEREKAMKMTSSSMAPGGFPRAQVAPAATTAAAAPAAIAAAGRSMPRLMEQQQEARGGAAAAMMINRQQWMDDYDEEEEEMYDDMEEIEEEMAYFDDEEEDEDNLGLD